MSILVPEALSIFSSAGSALQALVDWRKKSKGDTRAIVMELEGNENIAGTCGLRTLSS